MPMNLNDLNGKPLRELVRIGGEPPYPFLERCGVRIVTKEITIDTGAERSAG